MQPSGGFPTKVRYKRIILMDINILLRDISYYAYEILEIISVPDICSPSRLTCQVSVSGLNDQLSSSVCKAGTGLQLAYTLVLKFLQFIHHFRLVDQNRKLDIQCLHKYFTYIQPPQFLSKGSRLGRKLADGGVADIWPKSQYIVLDLVV